MKLYGREMRIVKKNKSMEEFLKKYFARECGIFSKIA